MEEKKAAPEVAKVEAEKTEEQKKIEAARAEELKRIEAMPVCEVRTFTRGPQTVIQIEEVETKKLHFVGNTHVGVMTPQGPQSMPIQFEFPDGIVDYKDAFAKFDAMFMADINRRKKEQEEKSKVVIPPSGFDISHLGSPGGNGKGKRRFK
jgi:hypothetical protein